jgi:hypothetical protein
MKNIRQIVKAGIMAAAVATLAGCTTATKNTSPRWAAAATCATGKIYANCDDAFVLYVNNREVLRNKDWTTAPRPVCASLKPGDVINVRVSDFGGEYGFAFLYCSIDKTKFFSANTNDWYSYSPANEITWWNVPDVAAIKLAPATEGNNKNVAAELQFQADAPCKNVIWGAIGEPTAFIRHVVTENDLKKMR